MKWCPRNPALPKSLPLKAEGMAAHPDAYGIGYGNGDKFGNDDRYLKQLQAYADWRGIDETKAEECSRPHLLEKLKAKGVTNG